MPIIFVLSRIMISNELIMILATTIIIIKIMAIFNQIALSSLIFVDKVI